MTEMSKCFFCGSNGSSNANNGVNVKEKLSQLVDYVGGNSTNYADSIEGKVFCGKCQNLLDSFSTIMETLQVAQMETDKKLLEICKVMMEGNKRESNSVDADANNNNHDREFRLARQEILDKSLLKVKKSQPLAVAMSVLVSGAGSGSGSGSNSKTDSSPEDLGVTNTGLPDVVCATASKTTSSLVEVKKELVDDRVRTAVILPEFIIRRSCIESKKETLYHCIKCERKFFNLSIHMKDRHEQKDKRNGTRQVVVKKEMVSVDTPTPAGTQNQIGKAGGSNSGVVEEPTHADKDKDNNKRKQLTPGESPGGAKQGAAATSASTSSSSGSSNDNDGVNNSEPTPAKKIKLETEDDADAGPSTSASMTTALKSAGNLPPFITKKKIVFKFNQHQIQYYCAECNQDVMSSNLTMHKRRHGIGRIPCNGCDKTFYSKQEMTKHVRKGLCERNKSATAANQDKK